MVISIQGRLSFLTFKSHGDRRRIRKIDVQPAIAIEIEQGDATAHRLDDVLGLWA